MRSCLWQVRRIGLARCQSGSDNEEDRNTPHHRGNDELPCAQLWGAQCLCSGFQWHFAKKRKKRKPTRFFLKGLSKACLYTNGC